MLNNPQREPRRSTNKHELFFKEKIYQVVGCAMEVLNTLGNGLLEKPYENALVVEFGLANISFQQQSRFPVIYKSVQVGEYIPDLIAFDKIVMEIKTINRTTDVERHRTESWGYSQFQTCQTGMGGI